MPRVAANGLTISDLERILATRRSQLRTLGKQRDRLARKLQAIDREIQSLGGGSRNGATGTRARNDLSLVAAIEQVLKKAGKPVNVGIIADDVRGLGYHSNSANFRGIVNQTLIKEKRFQQASRGMYQLKK